MNAGFVQAEDADDEQAGVADHGEGEQAAQIGLLEGECRGEENAGHREADDIGLPIFDRGRGEWQDEAHHAVDADLDPDHQRRGDGDQAMLGHVGQPAMQWEERRAHGQAVEEQIKRGGLELAGGDCADQFKEVEAPVTGVSVGIGPAQYNAAASEERPAESLVLDEAGQRLNFGA